MDSTPVSCPPENAPAWAVATESRSSSIASYPSDSTAGEDGNCQEFSMPQQMTPEAPPGVTANPRRLAEADAFQKLYGDPSSPSSSSDSDTD